MILHEHSKRSCDAMLHSILTASDKFLVHYVNDKDPSRPRRQGPQRNVNPLERFCGAIVCPLFEKPSRPPTPLFTVAFYRYSPSSHCNSSSRSCKREDDFGGAGARADKGKNNLGAHRASQRAGAEKLAQPGERQQPSALAGLEFAALAYELQNGSSE